MKSNQITSLFKYLMILVIVGSSTNLNAQTTRDFEDEHPLSAGDIVEISSAHHDININTWDKDMLRIEIHIEVNADSESDAAKVISLYEQSIEKTSWGVSIKLEPFSDKVKNINTSNGKTKMVLKSGETLHYSDLDVEVEIFTSKDHDLKLENSFSNVSLGELNAAADIILFSSSLKANNLNALKLETSFSDALFHDCPTIDVDVNSSEISFHTVKMAKVQSSFSEIEINDLHTIELQSQSDEIEIGRLEAIVGTGAFTSFEIGTVAKTVDLKAQSATVEIAEVESGFISIDLKSDFSTIEIDLEDDSYQLEVDANFSEVRTSDGEIESEGAFHTGIDYSGVIGNIKSPTSKIKISCNSCEVDLR